MKVLVVHRHEVAVQQIKAQLTQWYVRSSSSGLDGLLACRMHHFDLILSSFDLPVVTGIEMARSIRNFSLNKKTPIIMLAEGNETPEHFRIVHQMNAHLLTMTEVAEMQNLVLD